MKRSRFILTLSLGLAGLALSLPAWPQSATPSPSRMSECQKQANDKGMRSGPERRDFMRECVHGKPAAAKPAMAEPAKPVAPEAAKAAPASEPAKPAVSPPPGVKPATMGSMADCRKQADDKSLRGPERKDYMRDCMHPKK